MIGFEIRRESRIPSYTSKRVTAKTPRNILALALITGLTMHSFARDYMKMGIAVNLPVIESKAEAAAIVETMLSNALGVNLERDVLLVLTNATNVLTFRADGYSARLQFAWEWAKSYTYGKDDPETLNFDEVSFISNGRFGDTTVLWIYRDHPYEVSNSVNAFIGFYTNQSGKTNSR